MNHQHAMIINLRRIFIKQRSFSTKGKVPPEDNAGTERSSSKLNDLLLSMKTEPNTIAENVDDQSSFEDDSMLSKSIRTRSTGTMSGHRKTSPDKFLHKRHTNSNLKKQIGSASRDQEIGESEYSALQIVSYSRNEQRKTKRAGLDKYLEQTQSTTDQYLFNVKPLDIFGPLTKEGKSIDCLSWQNLDVDSLSNLKTQPPRNHFEKAVSLTNQGKLWTLPIDNMPLDNADKSAFWEHILLNPNISESNPAAVRHFIDLICVGLSKNSCLSSNDKKQHIDWYINFLGIK